ncbi:hypothetical protein EPI10_000966 [Gossypium australe]|uniref:Uncharacterized protein n=1 Tax=Gossypium australe TaxID=47621 RepID=A0A5B6V9H5_9ROSI|nr:hypothetical protein EPI10_000966 [Gossypium australe]
MLDAEIHLDAKGLGEAINEENEASSQDKAKAMIFFRHHLHEGLKTEYFTVKDTLVFWNSLKEIYDHQKTIILPKARYDWLHLILQDFKSMSEYNLAIFRITSQLKLCGENITDEDMLEKAYSTFHVNNSCPTDSTPFSEANVTSYSETDKGHTSSRGRGHGRGRGRDCGRGRGRE